MHDNAVRVRQSFRTEKKKVADESAEYIILINNTILRSVTRSSSKHTHDNTVGVRKISILKNKSRIRVQN